MPSPAKLGAAPARPNAALPASRPRRLIPIRGSPNAKQAESCPDDIVTPPSLSVLLSGPCLRILGRARLDVAAIWLWICCLKLVRLSRRTGFEKDTLPAVRRLP